MPCIPKCPQFLAILPLWQIEQKIEHPGFSLWKGSEYSRDINSATSNDKLIMLYWNFNFITFLSQCPLYLWKQQPITSTIISAMFHSNFNLHCHRLQSFKYTCLDSILNALSPYIPCQLLDERNIEDQNWSPDKG